MINIQGISPETIVRVYKGRIGCMCGCRGKYYDASTRSGKAMVNKVLRTVKANVSLVEVDPRGEWVSVQLDGKEHCIYLAD
jgi:hypothetical protein